MDYFAGLDISMDETHICVSTALAQGEGHPAARRGKLRGPHAPTRRCSLPCSVAHPRGARQSVDPFGRRALPDVPGWRSATGVAPVGVPLSPQARQLVEHGGDRDGRPDQRLRQPTARGAPLRSHRQPHRELCGRRHANSAATAHKSRYHVGRDAAWLTNDRVVKTNLGSGMQVQRSDSAMTISASVYGTAAKFYHNRSARMATHLRGRR